jgi:hypothetical protein
MAVTANPLDAAPTFRSAVVNDPADPFIRGTCGPFRCKAAYDFIDVQFAPDGTAWSPFVDGCANPDTCTALGELLVGHLTAATESKPAAAVKGFRVVQDLPATGVGGGGAAGVLLTAAAAGTALLRRRVV